MKQSIKVWLVGSGMAIISLPLSFLGLQFATPEQVPVTNSLLPLQNSAAPVLQAGD